ncbi:MAG TPA: TRAP transporter small permease subunit [Pseudomonadales bacterium]
MIARLVYWIDTASLCLGRTLAWMTLAMVLVMSGVVLMRYGLGRGSILLQDLVTYLYAAVFLLGAAYALRQDAHVRVDILYRRLSPVRQAWINLTGTVIFLLPFCAFVLWISRDYVTVSWRIREAAAEPDAIPTVFLLKSLIPAMAVTLALQGIAEALRAIMILRGTPLAPNHATRPPGEVL